MGQGHENHYPIGEFVSAVRRALVPATTRAKLVDCVREAFPAGAGGWLRIDEYAPSLEAVRPVAGTDPAFADREAVPLDGTTPHRRLLERALTTETVQFARGDELDADEVGAATESHAVAVVPLVPGGAPYGAVVLAFAESSDFETTDRRALAELRTVLESALEAFAPAPGGADRSDRTTGSIEDEIPGRALNGLPDPFYLCDLDGRFLSWNDAFEATTGYSAAEIGSMRPADFFVDDDRDRVARASRRLLEDGEEDVIVEGMLVTADGERVPVEVTGALVYDDAGDALGVCGVARDISDRKRHERQISHQRDQLAALRDHLLETVPTGVIMFDAGGDVTQYNRRAADILGEPGVEAVNDPVGESDWVLTTADGEPVPESAYPSVRVLETGEPIFNEEFRLERPEGGPIWVSVNGKPLSETHGETAAVFAFEDVTEQKRRERYLQDAKAQLEAAADAGAVGTWEWQIPEDRFVTGASFARTFGVDPEGARNGVPLEELVSSIHRADRERVSESIREAVATCGEYEEEYRVWNADGELRWVVARGHVECDEDGVARTFPGALADITDRKRAEEALRRHKDQLRTLIRLLPVGVVVADAQGRLVEANETAKEIWGGDIFDADSVGDYERFTAWWAETGEPLELDERPMVRVLDGEEITKPEILEIETIGGARRVIMVHGMPVRDSSGAVSRGVVTLTDITDRKQREQQLQRQNNRLESFASMLAHELRNPLSIGQIYLPQAASGDRDAVEEVETALDRMEKTIDMLLVLTRGSESSLDPKPVSLADTAREVWSGLETRGAALEADTDLVVDVEAHHLTHILENLFQNAVEHGGDEVTVRVGSLPDGFYVEDTGPGIPADDRDSVFEAGYSTGTTGLGLGLTFIAQLAEAYGWTYRLDESEEGGVRLEFADVSLATGG